jgi:ketosteroid isomerase-like protein
LGCFQPTDQLDFIGNSPVFLVLLSRQPVGNNPWPKFFSRIISKLPASWRDRCHDLRWQPLTSWLFLALLILTVIVPVQHIIYWGVFKASPAFKLPHEKWEVAALIWDLIFSVISYFYAPIWKSRERGPEIKLTRSHPFVALFFLVGGLGGTISALYFLAEHGSRSQLWHLVCVLVVAVCYAIADCLIWVASPSERPKFLKVLLYADGPTVVALGFFLFFVKNLDVMNTLVSGAIAFQFIANSLIFALIEGGVFEAFVFHPKALEGLKSVEQKWAQTIANRDINAFMTFLRENEVNMWLDYKWITDKDAIRKEWEKRLTDNNFSLIWEASSIEVSKDGSMGYTRGPYQYKKDGMQFLGNYATVWQKTKDGDWRVIDSMALPVQRQARSKAVGPDT